MYRNIKTYTLFYLNIIHTAFSPLKIALTIFLYFYDYYFYNFIYNDTYRFPFFYFLPEIGNPSPLMHS